MTPPTYPNALAECMVKAGLTDPQLAAAAGTTKQQIFKLRKGERKLTVEWAKRLAPCLGVTWQVVIEGRGASSDPQRSDIMRAYDATNEQGREMLLRLARSLERDAAEAQQAEAEQTAASLKSSACVMPINARGERRNG